MLMLGLNLSAVSRATCTRRVGKQAGLLQHELRRVQRTHDCFGTLDVLLLEQELTVEVGQVDGVKVKHFDGTLFASTETRHDCTGNAARARVSARRVVVPFSRLFDLQCKAKLVPVRTHVLDELASDSSSADDEDARVCDLVEELLAQDCFRSGVTTGCGGHRSSVVWWRVGRRVVVEVSAREGEVTRPRRVMRAESRAVQARPSQGEQPASRVWNRIQQANFRDATLVACRNEPYLFEQCALQIFSYLLCFSPAELRSRSADKRG